MPNFINLMGQKFSRLTVVSQSENRGQRVHWSCVCECGSWLQVSANKLQNGHTRSCGCLQREAASHASIIHGCSAYPNGGNATKEYNTWSLMKRRCHKESSIDYPLYGARGIKVCDRWKNDFSSFLEDMGSAPSIEHSIDRWPNNDGNYEPGNCRWATAKEQRRNQHRVKFLECRGELKTPAEWAETSGVSNKRIYARIKRGWSIERAIFTPAR